MHIADIQNMDTKTRAKYIINEHTALHISGRLATEQSIWIHKLCQLVCSNISPF